MNMRKKLICIITAIATAAFLILSPPYIKDGIEKGRVSKYEREKESYSGIITIWHIAGFRVYSGAVGNYLKEPAAQLSEKHFGVYYNVTSMSEQEYAERIARGESADIYSYPLGFEYSDKLMKLDTGLFPKMRQGLMTSGTDGANLYAVPYLYSGYLLAENCDKSDNAAVELSVDFVNNELSQNDDALCGDETAAVVSGLDKCAGNIDRFKSGECIYAVTDFRAVGDCIRKHEQGKGFSISAVPCTHYTDLVQYLCINKSIDERKVSYAYEYIDSVLSVKSQKKLAQMGAYPVIADIDTEEMRDSYSSAALDAYSVYLSPAIPNFFEYRICKDTLRSDAHDALSGDISARKRVIDRLSGLIHQK